jgi:Tfp pilus assembly protein PilN
MIRINLIQKKQASYVSSGAVSGGLSSLYGDLLNNFRSSGFQSFLPIFKSIGIPVLIALIANFGYDYYVSVKTSQMSSELAGLDSEKDRINKELQKIKGFESVKVELERSELVLRAKIDTIEKLIRGRDFTVKSLITLAQAMPRDIWMTLVKATDSAFEFKGGTIDMALVGDFQSKLGQTIYFKDVTLKSTARDANDKQANFELGARRE